MLLEVLAYKNNASQLYRRMLAPILREHNLTQLEMDVLLFLANNPGFDTARDLVDIRHLCKSHVSTAVESLVQRHFLERVQREGNKKLIHLILLPAAADPVSAGQAVQKKFFKLVFSDFTAQERAQLNSLMGRVERNAIAAAQNLEQSEQF